MIIARAKEKSNCFKCVLIDFYYLTIKNIIVILTETKFGIRMKLYSSHALPITQETSFPFLHTQQQSIVTKSPHKTREYENMPKSLSLKR